MILLICLSWGIIFLLWPILGFFFILISTWSIISVYRWYQLSVIKSIKYRFEKNDTVMLSCFMKTISIIFECCFNFIWKWFNQGCNYKFLVSHFKIPFYCTLSMNLNQLHWSQLNICMLKISSLKGCFCLVSSFCINYMQKCSITLSSTNCWRWESWHSSSWKINKVKQNM